MHTTLFLCLSTLASSVLITPSTRAEAVLASRKAGHVVVAPSVAKADFFKLGEELSAVVDAGAKWCFLFCVLRVLSYTSHPRPLRIPSTCRLHFSVQDGRMVPKISFGAPVIAGLRDHFPDTVFDVKLSVVEPEVMALLCISCLNLFGPFPSESHPPPIGCYFKGAAALWMFLTPSFLSMQ